MRANYNKILVNIRPRIELDYCTYIFSFSLSQHYFTGAGEDLPGAYYDLPIHPTSTLDHKSASRYDFQYIISIYLLLTIRLFLRRDSTLLLQMFNDSSNFL